MERSETSRIGAIRNETKRFLASLTHPAALDAIRETWHRWSAPLVRTLAEFAEQEIYLPTGPREKQRYRLDTQPYARLLFAEIDGGRWRRFAIVGPTQSGKSLQGHVLPVVYRLFELGETVIVGLPSIDMANDKWIQDILPVIDASRYRELIPDKGEGSRGGAVKSMIRFKNGAAIKFMSGGGGDAKRSGFSARGVFVTETDKLDETGGTSRETDKVGQLEARTDAYGERGLFFMESTPSFTTGRIWQEYTRGSESRIACPCPHCGEFVTPGRDSLVGWQDCDEEADAKELAHWTCPACKATLSETQRREMNQAAALIHKRERTDTLGFRWDAFNNLFWTAGFVGAEEWKASHATAAEESETKMKQFRWALPHDPPNAGAMEPGKLEALRDESHKWGTIPAAADCHGSGGILIVTVDPGGGFVWYQVQAWRIADGASWLVELGRMGDKPDVSLVPSEEARMQIWSDGVSAALRALSERCTQGWPVEGKGELVFPTAGYVDRNFATDAVDAFVRAYNGWHGVFGSIYAKTPIWPEKASHSPDGAVFYEANTNRAKFLYRSRFEKAGSLFLPYDMPEKRLQLLEKHMAGELWDQANAKWKRIGDNHFFDTGALQMCGAKHKGVRVMEDGQMPAATFGRVSSVREVESRQATTGGRWSREGRPFVATKGRRGWR